MKKYITIDLNTTTSCNLRCSFCSVGMANGVANSPFANLNTKLSLNKLIKLINTDLSESEGYEHIRIGFFGGEPLNNFEFIQSVIDNFKNDERISFFFYTNGLLLPRYIKNFKKWYNEFGKNVGIDGKPRLHIQISYDGEYQTNKLRIDANGNGTAKKVKNAYKIAKKSGISVSLKATIVAESYPYLYDTFLEFIEDLDNGYYAPTPDTHSERDRDLHKQDMEILYQQLSKIGNYILKHNLKPETFGWINKRTALCSVGHHLNMIDINGDVTVCHGASYMDDRDNHILGHVDDFKNVEKNMEQMSYVLDKNEMADECKNCDVFYCMRCNIVNELKSDKPTYRERMMDFPANFQLCETFKTADIIHKTLRYAIAV